LESLNLILIGALDDSIDFVMRANLLIDADGIVFIALSKKI